MSATRRHPDPSAKAPWTRTTFLTGSACAGASAADRSATAAAAATRGLFGIELSFITKDSTNGLNKGWLDKLSTHWLNIVAIEDQAGIGMMEIGARKAAASRTARLDAVFAALADPTRRAIIERLSRGEARV